MKKIKLPSSSREKTSSDLENFHRYCRDLEGFETVSHDEEIQLSIKIKAGDETAVNDLIQANLRLVILIASEYENLGLSTLDLISEGNLGLSKAVRRFDHERKVKFSFYAGLWIRQQIKRALSNKSRTIRIPVSMVEKISKIEKKKAQKDFSSVSEVNTNSQKPQSDRQNQLVTLAKAYTVSLDTPIEQDEGGTLGDVIPDSNCQHPLEELIRHGDYHLISDKIKLLDSREQQVMKTRFGLDGCKPSKLIEIADLLGLTKERVRQIEEFAIVKLRRMFFAEQGEEYLMTAA
ncbi:RNA polymerase sigma factor RpoD/SigA [bacterium]|nr:RNA polymerase sigma factor RpoD/SigA [bacterium]